MARLGLMQSRLSLFGRLGLFAVHTLCQGIWLSKHDTDLHVSIAAARHLPLFLTPKETYAEAKPIDLAFTGELSIAVAMLAVPLLTFLFCHYELQLLMALGFIMSGIVYISASSSQGTRQLYLSQSVLVGLVVRFLDVPRIAILP
jgi:hypothetical protein